MYIQQGAGARLSQWSAAVAVARGCRSGARLSMAHPLEPEAVGVPEEKDGLLTITKLLSQLLDTGHQVGTALRLEDPFEDRGGAVPLDVLDQPA